MSYVFSDSFKSYATSSDLSYRYTFTNGPQMMNVMTYDGDPVLSVTGIGHVGEMQYFFPSSYPFVNLQFEMNILTIPATIDFIKLINPTSTTNMSIGYNPFNNLLRFDGAILGPTTAFSSWIPVSIYAHFGAGVTTATWWVDNVSGTKTTTSANTMPADRFSIRGFNGANNGILIKNLVIRCRTSGEGDFTDKAARKFRTDNMVPTSTRLGEFQAIDAPSNHQAIANLAPSYLQCTSATGSIDLYGYSRPVPTGAIKGISIVSLVPQVTHPTAISGAISGTSTVYFPLSNTGGYATLYSYETNPFNGQPWQSSDFSNFYVGFKQ